MGRTRRTFGELPDLVSDNGEATARLPGARRLDGRIQSEEVGLVGDVRDHVDDRADLLRALSESPDGLGRAARDFVHLLHLLTRLFGPGPGLLRAGRRVRRADRGRLGPLKDPLARAGDVAHDLGRFLHLLGLDDRALRDLSY